MSARADDLPEPARLEFARVTKWYGAVAALTDVSFRIGREIVGLVGKNGVGKSTLMKLGASLLRPSQGTVTIAGHPTGSLRARAVVGYSPDLERLYEDRSAVEFVASMLRYHRVPRRSAEHRSREVLTELGLGENMHRAIREYSKGMRQRVRLAQALAHRPLFVLLDEPMTGLDPVARNEFARHIRSLPAQGVGVLVSSHVLHELEAIVDRVVLVHQGRLLAQGRIDELRAQLTVRPHRLRVVAERPRDLAARFVQWPHVAGVRVVGDALELEVSGDPAFYLALTELGAEWPGGLLEVVPLDDNLASVFGYLTA